MDNFNLLTNLPWLIFALLFLVVFGLFLYAGILLLKGKNDPESQGRGKVALIKAIWSFGVVVIIVLVFYTITFFLKKGEAFQPQPESSGEFPASPAIGFPAGPEFFKVGDYYFTGPYSFKELKSINSSAIFSILCKNNDNYDIIAIEEGERVTFTGHKNYQCWLNTCDIDSNNLYIALFQTPFGKYDAEDIRDILESLRIQIEPSCSLVE